MNQISTQHLRIVVAGLAGSFPMAGSFLSWFQYALGFHNMGHEVLYLEDTGAWYYDPNTDQVVDDESVPLSSLSKRMNHFGLGDNWTFIDHRGTEFGVTGLRLREFLSTADILVHVTGSMYLHDQYMQIPVRTYIDTDPGFIQLRIMEGSSNDLAHLKNHNCHFSFACNIGKPDCIIDTCGLQWHPTVQPIFLPLWPVTNPPPDANFTTIVKWDASGHGPITHDSEVFGLKDMEFIKFKQLPELTDQSIEIAMAGDPPTSDMEELGWLRCSGPKVSKTIDSYRNYIQSSKAEWSIAKNGYVKTRGGWFSDRSAAYLASGRPTVLQSTGFESWLPTGHGVISFQTLQQAVSAIDEVNSNYSVHSRVARELAETYFASGVVLRNLIDIAMTSPTNS